MTMRTWSHAVHTFGVIFPRGNLGSRALQLKNDNASLKQCSSYFRGDISSREFRVSGCAAKQWQCKLIAVRLIPLGAFFRFILCLHYGGWRCILRRLRLHVWPNYRQRSFSHEFCRRPIFSLNFALHDQPQYTILFTPYNMSEGAQFYLFERIQQLQRFLHFVEYFFVLNF